MPILFIAVLAVYQVLLFFVHAAVYKTLVVAFGWSWRWPVAVVFGLLSLTFVSASYLTYTTTHRLARWYYSFSAYWFGLIHFLFVGSFVFYLLEVVLYNNEIYVAPAILASICLGVMFIIHTYATIQTRIPKLTRVEVALPNVPEAWRGKKVVFVSDIHIGAIWNRHSTMRIVEKIRKESPESVLIGGDAFDGVKCDGDDFTIPFSSLHPPKGIYFISGNHEYINNNNGFFFEAVRKAGVRILNNEKVDFDGIQLLGVDWKDSHAAADFERILKDIHIDRSKPSILLKHEPNDLAVAEKAGVSLQLSGHTHQGQIFPLSLITKRIYRGYDYGLKKLGSMMVGVSSGVGTWGPPLRFGTKSEIIVITFI
jgi:predicted MPP superfamily phosphohydrolase